MLDEATYKPIIEKAWNGLVSCINESGKIGYIQRVGANPNSASNNDSMEYGPGAFLLAGKEMFELMPNSR